jgi:hypothetical protein
MKTGLKIGIGLVAATLLFTIISNMVVSGTQIIRQLIAVTLSVMLIRNRLP